MTGSSTTAKTRGGSPAPASGDDPDAPPFGLLQSHLAARCIASVAVISVFARAVLGVHPFGPWTAAAELLFCVGGLLLAAAVGSKRILALLLLCAMLALPASLLHLRSRTSGDFAASVAAVSSPGELQARLLAAEGRAAAFENAFCIALVALLLAMCCPLKYLAAFGATTTAGLLWASSEIRDPSHRWSIWSTYGVIVATTAVITSFVRESQRHLYRAVVHAREAADAKDRFTANITHELRTPLTAIIGMSELMSDYPMPDDQRSLLDIMATAASGMLELVNDLLDFAKIQFGGSSELRAERFVLVPFLCSLMDVLWGRFMGGPVSLRLLVSRDAARVLVGDSHKLRQILLNLLSNACKFTADGEVCLRVALAAVEEPPAPDPPPAPLNAEPAPAPAPARRSASPRSGSGGPSPRPPRPRARSDSASSEPERQASPPPPPRPAALERVRCEAGCTLRGSLSAPSSPVAAPSSPRAFARLARLSAAALRSRARSFASSRPSTIPEASSRPASSEGLDKARPARRLWLALSVVDTGRGIAPDDAPKLFQRFSQLGDVMLNKNKGTGLGLAIVDGLVRELGGRIEVTSVLHQGSDFTCIVPLEDAGADEHLAAFRACPPASPAVRPGEHAVPPSPASSTLSSGAGWAGGASAMRRPFEPAGEDRLQYEGGVCLIWTTERLRGRSGNYAPQALQAAATAAPPAPASRPSLSPSACGLPPLALPTRAAGASAPAGSQFALGPGAWVPQAVERTARVEEPPPAPAARTASVILPFLAARRSPPPLAPLPSPAPPRSSLRLASRTLPCFSSPTPSLASPEASPPGLLSAASSPPEVCLARRSSAAPPATAATASGAATVWGWRIGRRSSSPAILAANSPAERKGPGSPPPTPPAAARVLLADDEQVNRLLAGKLLAALGAASVEAARDGADAVERYEAACAAGAPHDVVILGPRPAPSLEGPDGAADLQMPNRTGLEAVGDIRRLALAAGRPLPLLVAWTACAGEQTREKCRAAGFARFVGKPCRKADFEAILKALACPDPAA